MRLQFVAQRRVGTDFQKPLKDPADDDRLSLVHNQPSIGDVVAERRRAARPLAALLHRGNLVADAVGNHLALELCESQQDIQDKASHAVGGIERLGDRHERDTKPVENIDQADEIGQTARKSVNFVDYDDTDEPALDVGEQSLKARPMERAARLGEIIIARRQFDPALVLLRLDIGGANLALCLYRVVIALIAVVCTFAGVDRTAD